MFNMIFMTIKIEKKTLKIFGHDAMCAITMQDERGLKSWEGSFEIDKVFDLPENWRNKIETEIGDIYIQSFHPVVNGVKGTFIGSGPLNTVGLGKGTHS